MHQVHLNVVFLLHWIVLIFAVAVMSLTPLLLQNAVYQASWTYAMCVMDQMLALQQEQQEQQELQEQAKK